MPFKKGVLARAPFAINWSQQVAAATLTTTNGVFANPLANGEIYEFLGADYSYDVLSTSGTLDLRNVVTATAFTGGVSLLASTGDLNATARVARKAVITTTLQDRRIMPGSHLSLILGGTLTSLVGLNVIIWLQAMRGIRAR